MDLSFLIFLCSSTHLFNFFNLADQQFRYEFISTQYVCKIISTIHVWVCHIPLAPKKPPSKPMGTASTAAAASTTSEAKARRWFRHHACMASFPRLYDDGLPMTSYVLMWPYYFFLPTSYFLSTSSCSFSFFLRSLRLQLSSSFHTARRPPPLLFLLFLSFLSFYLPSYDDVLPYSSSTFPITTSYPPTCKYSYRHFNFIWRYNRLK